MTKLKRSNFEENTKKKFKLWQNKKIQMVSKLKNTNCDKTNNNQIVTKLKKSNCDQTKKKLKLWQPSVVTVGTVVTVMTVLSVVTVETVVKKKKSSVTFFCPWNCDKTQKLKLWQKI